MLKTSKIIFYNVDTGKFEIMDKLLATTEYSFDLATETIRDWVYDMKRRLLWIITNTALYRVRLDFNATTGVVESHTVEATITVLLNDLTYGYGKILDIHWKTGACFYLYRTKVPEMRLYKIVVDASIATSVTIVNELNVIPNNNNNSPASLCIDQSTGSVLCMYYNQYNSSYTTLTNHHRWGVLVKNDLSSYYDIFNYALVSSSTNSPMANYLNNTYNWGVSLNSRLEITFDPTTGLVKWAQGGNQSIVNLFKVVGNRAFVEYEERSATWQQVVGYKTGNKYTWSDTILKCIDKNGVELYNINLPFANWGFIFNPYTEEFYRVNTTTKVLYAYDRWARQVGARTAFTTAPSFFLSLPGGENAVSIGISPNIVVSPNANQRTSDTTPQ